MLQKIKHISPAMMRVCVHVQNLPTSHVSWVRHNASIAPFKLKKKLKCNVLKDLLQFMTLQKLQFLKIYTVITFLLPLNKIFSESKYLKWQFGNLNINFFLKKKACLFGD